MTFDINNTLDISKLSQISLAQWLMKLHRQFQNIPGGVYAKYHAITYTYLLIHWQEPSCDTNENTVQPVVPSDEADFCDKLVFPELSESDINCYIDQQENVAAPYMVKSPEPCVVPSNLVSSKQQHYIPSRKLEVLRDCVAYIFDNQISEARKVFHLNSTVRILFLAVKLNVLKNNIFLNLLCRQ